MISLLPAHPAAYGKIAFVSTRDEGWEIYVMDGDGGNVRRITNNTVNEGNPVWSPDGKKIVFTSDKDNENMDLPEHSKYSAIDFGVILRSSTVSVKSVYAKKN